LNCFCQTAHGDIHTASCVCDNGTHELNDLCRVRSNEDHKHSSVSESSNSSSEGFKLESSVSESGSECPKLEFSSCSTGIQSDESGSSSDIFVRDSGSRINGAETCLIPYVSSHSDVDLISSVDQPWICFLGGVDGQLTKPSARDKTLIYCRRISEPTPAQQLLPLLANLPVRRWWSFPGPDRPSARKESLPALYTSDDIDEKSFTSPNNPGMIFVLMFFRYLLGDSIISY